jgi:hypothetical protein
MTVRLHSIPRGRARWLTAGMTVTAALAVTLAACSNPGSTTTHTKHDAAAPSSAAPATSTPASAAAASGNSGLSGTWHGQYGGAYAGTFVLRWHQSGPDLSGHIHISNPSSTLPVHGKLAGGSIRFGTVGSYRISYTGTVSGSSMSGNWQLNGPGTGGTWSASKG